MPNPSKAQFYKTVYKILNQKKYKKTLDIGCGHLDLYNNIITYMFKYLNSIFL